MKYFGAHVSASGGVSNSPANAEAIGARGFALFTKNQRQWVAPPLKSEEIERFIAECHTKNFPPHAILPHNSYLTNLGNADGTKWEQSLNALIDEMERCHSLGLDRLNFHPGSHLNQISVTECLSRIAEGINRTLDATHGVCAVLENTAGQGTNLGYRFEQLAEIIEQVEDKSRIGVCIDTCHAHAAGYDLSTEAGFHETFETLDKIVGLKYLRGLHLNDALREAGSRIDRHAPIGAGTIGETCFRLIAQDKRFDALPIILETPKPELWPEEIAQLIAWEKEAQRSLKL